MTDATQAEISAEEVKPRFTPQLRHIIGVGVAILALLLIPFAFNFLTDVPLRISKETTYITEPLTPDGQRVDYFAAMEQYRYPPEMQTDNNGYRMIVRELGVSNDLSPHESAQIYAKLGLDPTIPPNLSFQEPYKFLEEQIALRPDPPEYNELDNLAAKLVRPWTLKDLPMMAEWLQENSAALDVLNRAARKPTLCSPYVMGHDASMSILTSSQNEQSRSRQFARSLQARAMFRVASGEIDAAIEDIITIRRIAYWVSHKCNAIDLMIGVSHESVAAATGIAAALEHPPTAEQLRRLIDELDQIHQTRSLESVVHTSRLELNEIVQSMTAEDYGEDFGNLTSLRRMGASFDWNIFAETANKEWVRISKGGTPTPYTFSLQLMRRSHRSEALGSIVGGLLAPAFSSLEHALHRPECSDQLLRISLAMLLYERQHGTLPPEFSVDAQGKPLHSWRVLLLPFLGQQELYDKLRLDEPWDSTHNQQFHAEVVAAFQCPSGHGGPGETTYTVISGDTTPFQGGVGKRLDSFGPKSANMILVAERTNPVCWMDPNQEVPLAEALLGINRHKPGTSPTHSLGSPHPGGLHVALRSASVTFLSENIDPTTLQGYLEGTNDVLP